MAAPLSLLLHPYYFPERVEIYKAYMRSDFSTQQPNALTNILLINDQIKHEYESVFVNEAQNVAARLRQDLTPRFPLLDFTVKIPQTWDEAKCLSMNVAMSAANITQPRVFRTFTEQILRERTLLHTRTLELRLVAAHPPRPIPPSASSGTGAGRYHTPRHLSFALGQDIVNKFTGSDETRKSGVSKVVVSWDVGMDINDEWSGLLQHLHVNVAHSLGWYGQRVAIIAQGVRQVQWWIL